MAKRVVISGASGFVGSQLTEMLLKNSYEVIGISRRKHAEAVPSYQILEWNQEHLIRKALEGADAVINLAGESIAAFRYSEKKRKSIKQSRLAATKSLADWTCQCKVAPQVFISASAIGYYGDRGDEVLTESSVPGAGFLAEVGQLWEEAAHPVQDKTRLVTMRLGVVLDRAGGILKKLQPIYAAHLGMNMGSGQQWFSWIHMNDLLNAILKFITDPTYQGVYNLCSPHPVHFFEFHRALQEQIKSQSFLWQPTWLMRLVMGEAADLLLNSARVSPTRLLASGFRFELDTIDKALATPETPS